MKRRKTTRKTISINNVELTESKKLRVRRTFQLATTCICNIAAYKANWKKDQNNESHLVIHRDFWRRANGNFLDIAVLEWCKVFSERTGEHHWSRIFKTKQDWMASLFYHMNMTQKNFNNELVKVVKYRNKYVAHLEPIPMKYPSMDFLYKSI